jgi:hypothetical protein
MHMIMVITGVETTTDMTIMTTKVTAPSMVIVALVLVKDAVMAKAKTRLFP